ncbi:hypothetical protein BpHYR1_028641 [Brachionus plicatilis]|uniref:Uncharacterized protein n=1 Tax=Brachionus plicatilis TaxID=10195 RepID=A0A3M7RCS3_BRAPC|nr:hypothetical protein BpHYR1_028641 [Brachionus plicatilis]
MTRLATCDPFEYNFLGIFRDAFLLMSKLILNEPLTFFTHNFLMSKILASLFFHVVPTLDLENASALQLYAVFEEFLSFGTALMIKIGTLRENNIIRTTKTTINVFLDILEIKFDLLSSMITREKFQVYKHSVSMMLMVAKYRITIRGRKIIIFDLNAKNLGFHGRFCSVNKLIKLNALYD